MRKILIVDDDATFAQTVEDAMPADTYAVVIAKNGEEGLEMFDKEKPDLVLLDILMPKVSGIGFLKKLKERETPNTIPVIVSSNLDSMEEISAALALGAQGYIVKSDQDLKSIVETVKRTLDDQS